MDRNSLLRTIWGRSKQLGIDKEELHILLGRETGKDSMKECSEAELMKLLKALDFFKQKEELQNGGKKLSEAQKKYITDLAQKLGWATESPKLKAFIKRNTGIDNIKWLSPRQASNIIEGLKNMIRRLDVQAEVIARANEDWPVGVESDG